MNALSICEWMWLAWFVIWMIWAAQSKKTHERESLGSVVSYGVFAWAAMLLMIDRNTLGAWGRSTILPQSTWMNWGAVAFAVVGFAITVWARAILGSNWSGTVTIKVEHELIRTGPYRWVRHPIYSGLIMALLGTLIALDQWRGIVALPLLWVAFAIKYLKEEQAMRQTFGEQYDEYSQTTGAIFPRLLNRNN
jgi:protein-S-isoprenylcysteine O-methyltransferase Ste14